MEGFLVSAPLHSLSCTLPLVSPHFVPPPSLSSIPSFPFSLPILYPLLPSFSFSVPIIIRRLLPSLFRLDTGLFSEKTHRWSKRMVCSKFRQMEPGRGGTGTNSSFDRTFRCETGKRTLENR